MKVFVSRRRCVALLSVAELFRKTPSQSSFVNIFWEVSYDEAYLLINIMCE